MYDAPQENWNEPHPDEEQQCFYCHDAKPNSAERLHICKSCAEDMWIWDESTFRCDCCRVDYHEEMFTAKIGGDNDAMFCTDCFWRGTT